MPQRCIVCGEPFVRVAQHYATSSCRENYEEIMTEQREQLARAPRYHPGLVGPDRPAYQFQDDSREEVDDRDDDTDQMEVDEGGSGQGREENQPFDPNPEDENAIMEQDSSVSDIIKPFRTLSDFNFALWCRGPHGKRISNEDITILLTMLHSHHIKLDDLTLRNGVQIDTMLKDIGSDHMPFTCKNMPLRGYEDLTVDFWYRDTELLIKSLLKREDLAPYIHFRGQEEFDEHGYRIYSECYSGTRWAEQQTRLNGKCLLAIILSADETNLSIFSGNSKAHPVYITLGNIETAIRTKSSNRAVLTAALLPSVPGSSDEKKTVTYKLASAQLLADCLDLLLAPLIRWTRFGGTFQGPVTVNGNQYLGRPVLWAVCCDHLEGCKWTNLKSNCCLYCTLPSTEFPNLLAVAEKRSVKRAYRYFMEAEELLDDDEYAAAKEVIDNAHLDAPSGVPVGPPFKEWKYADLYQAAASLPDILHFILKGVFGNHIIDSFIPNLLAKLTKRLRDKVTSQFNNAHSKMPSFTDLKRFPNGIFKLGQTNGKDMRNMLKTLMIVLQSSLSSDVRFHGWNRNKFLEAVRLVVDIYYMISAPVISEELLRLLGNKLERLNNLKSISELLSDSKLKFVKWHKLSHLVEQIRASGMPLNYSTELYEHLHSERLKNVYRTSNQKEIVETLAKAETKQDALYDCVLQLQELELECELYEKITSTTTAAASVVKDADTPSTSLCAPYDDSYKDVNELAELTGLDAAFLERRIRIYLLREFVPLPAEGLPAPTTVNLPSLDDERIYLYKAIRIRYSDIQMLKTFHQEYARCSVNWHSNGRRNDWILLVKEEDEIAAAKYSIAKLLALMKLKFLGKWREVCLVEMWNILPDRDLITQLYKVEPVLLQGLVKIDVINISTVYRCCHVVECPVYQRETDSDNEEDDGEEGDQKLFYLNHFIDLQTFVEFL